MSRSGYFYELACEHVKRSAEERKRQAQREAIVRLMRDVLDATEYEIQLVLKQQGLQ